MKLLERFLPKPVDVAVIHAEFDSAQDRILDECDQILADLKIPTETQVEKKAKMLKELGFVNSETVEQAKRLEEHNKEIKQKIDITAKQAETIKYFKQKYTFEKFITTEELDKICNKYNLIHAPVSNYIKDIPEKNVLEMRNCKKLEFQEKAGIFNEEKDLKTEFFNNYKNYFNFPNQYEFFKHNIYGAHYRISLEIVKEKVKNETISDNFFLYDPSPYRDKHRVSLEQAYDCYISEEFYWGGRQIDKSGLFIAAPKSHFNLNGLTKDSKFGFFKVTEVKDPVVFEYCRDGIVRIISKWGVEGEDKAYLDPTLQNEILN